MPKFNPYPFQEIGIAKTLEMKRVINGDDMGCGKTVTSLAIAEQWNNPKLLIICIISKLND